MLCKRGYCILSQKKNNSMQQRVHLFHCNVKKKSTTLNRNYFNYYVRCIFEQFWLSGNTGKTHPQWQSKFQQNTGISSKVVTNNTRISAIKFSDQCIYHMTSSRDCWASNSSNLGVMSSTKMQVQASWGWESGDKNHTVHGVLLKIILNMTLLKL